MTRQGWTAVVSTVCFVALALAVALWHVPFVTWGPGRTLNLLGTGENGAQALKVQGTKTYQVSGELRMTTVSVTRVDSHLSLLEGLYAHFMPSHDVLPRDVIYPRTMSIDEVNQEEVAEMDDAKSSAVVAALREAHQPVQAMPMVQQVSIGGPSYNKLQPGDLIERVDQSRVTTTAQVGTLIRKHAVGDAVVFSVLRSGHPKDVTITTVASNRQKDVAVVGIGLATGYQYAPTVSYGIDPDVVGPSAGLVFSLAIYDMVTPGDLVGGRSIAGTGTIDANGKVGAIGGIQEKIAGAQQAGAKIFLVPAANCVDLAGVSTSMQLVKVATLDDAAKALATLKTGGQAPHC